MPPSRLLCRPLDPSPCSVVEVNSPNNSDLTQFSSRKILFSSSMPRWHARYLSHRSFHPPQARAPPHKAWRQAVPQPDRLQVFPCGPIDLPPPASSSSTASSPQPSARPKILSARVSSASITTWLVVFHCMLSPTWSSAFLWVNHHWSSPTAQGNPSFPPSREDRISGRRLPLRRASTWQQHI